MTQLRTVIVVISLATFFAPVAALAVDGVLEINQECALKTGCFGGDAAAFPVTISASGSYRLTSNLTNADQDQRMIDVAADHVTIDLNGFSIVGPVTCTRAESALSCGPAGSGQGIHAEESSNTTVLNGTVRGAGLDGLSLGQSCRIEGVTAENNGRLGISGGRLCNVRSSSARENATVGMAFGDGSVVENSVTAENGDIGLSLDANTRAIGVAASQNNYGIVVAAGSLVQGCVAQGNTNHGIRVVGPGSRVESSVATGNNIGISIEADRCTAVNNTSTDNGSTGIASGFLASTFHRHGVFDGNHVARNTARGMQVTGTDNLVVRNVAQDNGTAYLISPGNQVGTVVSAVDAVGVVGSSGGNLGAAIGAWANFTR